LEDHYSLLVFITTTTTTTLKAGILDFFVQIQNSNQVMSNKRNLKWRPPPTPACQLRSHNLHPVVAGYTSAKLH